MGVTLAALLPISLVAATTASAGSVPGYLQFNSDPGLVQAAEGNQNIEPQPGDTNTLDVKAHGYADLTGQLNTYKGLQLKVRITQAQAAARGNHAVTLLDFTGDWRPDILVDTVVQTDLQPNPPEPIPGRAYVYDVSGVAGNDRCVAVPPRSEALFDVATGNYNDTSSRRNTTAVVPLEGLRTATGLPFTASALSNPPRLVTMAAVPPTPDGPPPGPADDTMPSAAAAPAAGCATGQFAYDFSKATARYTAGSAPARDVTHTDPADNAGGYADLRRVSLRQWEAEINDGDAVSYRDQSFTANIHPTELTLDFATATNVASDTWLFPGTWNRSTDPLGPSVLIRTEAASNGRVKVTTLRNLPAQTYARSNPKACLRTNPTVAAGDTRTFTVPLEVLSNGNRRVMIPLETLIPPTGGLSQPVQGAEFRFHTISDPGQVDGQAPIDHVPLFAGYAGDGTDLATGCDAGGGEAGATVHLDRSFTVGNTALPRVELNATTTTPTRGQPVTFDLGQTAAGTRVCSFLRAFTPNDCSTPFLTQSYSQNATAYVAVDTSTGPWDQASLDIKVQNQTPTATISRVGTTPPQGTDGSYAIVQGAAVSIPLQVTGSDDDPGTTFTYRWTLDGAATSVSTASTYTPTFTTPGVHTVRAYVTDDSEDPATSESPAAELTITVVRSPQGAVEIVRPARVVVNQPFDIEAQTEVGTTGFQTLTWQWDLDGDADVDFDPSKTTRQLPGLTLPDISPAHLVRVRATDAGGRTADATIALNVRRPNDTAPSAKFTVTTASPKSGAPTTFDASTTEFNNTEGGSEGPVGPNPTGARFRWSFGDGTPEVVTTTPTTSHTYAGSGRAKASLIVEDVRQTPTTISDPAEKTVIVAPGATDSNAPVATLVRQDPPVSDPVFVGRPVTVTAAGSTAAPGHAPLSYAFDLDGNGSFERVSGTEPTVTFTPTTAGPLIVRVRVTDDLTSTSTAALTLAVNAEPIAKPTAVLAGPGEVSLTGVTVDAAYDATGSKGNNLDPAVTFRWDLDGDGSFETPTGSDPKVTATFDSPGAKTVKLRVTDRYGNTEDAEKTTIVRSAADIAAGCTGDSSFREAEYGNIRLRGCVVTVERPSAGDLFVITGRSIQFNGMRLSERSGTRPTPRPFADCNATDCRAVQNAFNAAGSPWGLALDTSDGSLRSNGLTSLRATGSGIDLPLLGGALNVTLPSEPEDGFTLATPQAAELLGFPLAGSVSLTFPDPGESVITVNVGLPSVLGGFTGTAGIRTTASGGVLLDELRIEVGEVTLGKLSLGNLFFVYSRPESLWEGGASLTLPTPKPLTISAELAIQNNRFKRIWAEVAGLNQPIAQAIYLQAIRAGIAVDPLDLTAGVTLSAGPAVKNKAVVSLDGDLRLRFPSPAANYYLFALTGKLKVADFQLASAFAQFTSNGFFELGGNIDASFGIGYFNAGIRGWIAPGAFNVDGDAEVGVEINGSRVALLGGHVTLGTTGFGACGEVPVLDVGAGFGTRWGSGVDFFWGCDLSPYRAARPADAPATPEIAAGARAVRTDLRRGRLLLAGPEGHLLTLPSKQEKALVTVTGRSASPRVAIVDANGEVLLSTPADGKEVITKQMMVTTDAKQKTTTILWKAPPGGKAWVVAQQGSSAVTKVDLALPAPKRNFGVTVGGSGRSRTLNWKITPALQRGETVQIAEEGAEAGTELVTTAKSTGSIPFTPQGGKSGKRSVVATVSADGLPGNAETVATYTAPPPPAPATPAALDLKRSSSGVLVSWKAGVGGGVRAAKWRAVVRVAHSQRKQLLVVDGNRTSVRIPHINPSDAVSVVLTGADAAGVEGPSRKAVIKAGLRASSGPLSLSSTAVPRDVVVRRLGGNRLRVTWKTGPAFVRGWSIRVSAAQNGRRKGAVTLLRSAGDDHSVDFANVPKGELRVSVIGRRFQGTATRKDVKYLGGTLRVH